jgi:hypothetical protein
MKCIILAYYRGASEINVKLTMVYYDPKEPSENVIGGLHTSGASRPP